jgi:hypothetical protein
VISGTITSRSWSGRKGCDQALDHSGKDEGISESDLQVAWNAEYLENEILPATDVTEDWLKLIDYDPGQRSQDFAGQVDRSRKTEDDVRRDLTRASSG